MANKKVLIVDDQEMIRKLVKMTLSSHNFDISEANNADEALQMVLKTRPDVIILDIMMPGELNGIEACKKIRQIPGFEETIILMLSAKTQEIDKEEGMDAGATDYLVKPFSPEYLLIQIKHYLNETQ